MVCLQVIRVEVWMCTECSAIQCGLCLQIQQQKLLGQAKCPSCRVETTESRRFVRCRQLEQLIEQRVREEQNFCASHKDFKCYYCEHCKEPVCSACLNDFHQGHLLKNLLELQPQVQERLQVIH